MINISPTRIKANQVNTLKAPINNSQSSPRSQTIARLVLLLISTLLIKNIYAESFSVPPPPALTPSDKQSSRDNLASSHQDQNKSTNKSKKPPEQQQQFPKPEVVIRYKENTKIAEYRVRGQLRYAKITPNSGPAYYLIDSTGDGSLDKRSEQLENPPINQWLLFSW